MSTGIALILVAAALASIVSAGILLPRRRDDRAEGGFDHSSDTAGEVESELLRRPLRSRYSA